MKKYKNNYLLLLLVGVLFLGIGYAAISNITLNINGSATANGTATNEDFKVRFVKFDSSDDNYVANASTNAAVVKTTNGIDAANVSIDVIADDKAQFSISEGFDEVGDFVTLEYNVVNESEGLPAYIYVDVENESNTASDYFAVTKTIEDNELSEGEVTKVIVKVELIARPKLDKTGNFAVKLIASPIKEESGSGTGGNIEDGPHSLTVSDLTSSSNLVSEGDGLYEDPYENGRYIYRGLSPNNYLTFNGEEAGWRIVAIESDQTVKIIRDSDVTNMVFDESNARSSSTYCYYSRDYGCNAWAATSDLIGNPAQFILYNPDGNQATATNTFAGTVTKNSSLNTWLNNEYYNNTENNVDYLNSDKSFIVAHNFFVGTPGNFADEESISDDIAQEKNYIWNGYVGLITATDFMKASIGDSCTNLRNFGSSSKCGRTNYLTPQSGEYWTISPAVSQNRGMVWLSFSSGYFAFERANVSGGVRPSVFLTTNIKLSGEGTKDKPYEIVE